MVRKETDFENTTAEGRRSTIPAPSSLRANSLTGSVPEASGPIGSAPTTAALQERYHRYRLQQGRDLLALLSKEGMRALLRRRALGERSGDPSLEMEELATMCADLLPLPPFSVWLEDFRQNREAYVEHDRMAPAGPAGPEGAPVTIAVRSFLHDGEAWTAELVVREDPPSWCGRVQFRRGEGEPVATTGEIFRDVQAALVRERWRSFDDRALSGFLRSALD